MKTTQPSADCAPTDVHCFPEHTHTHRKQQMELKTNRSLSLQRAQENHLNSKQSFDFGYCSMSSVHHKKIRKQKKNVRLKLKKNIDGLPMEAYWWYYDWWPDSINIYNFTWNSFELRTDSVVIAVPRLLRSLHIRLINSLECTLHTKHRIEFDAQLNLNSNCRMIKGS